MTKSRFEQDLPTAMFSVPRRVVRAEAGTQRSLRQLPLRRTSYGHYAAARRVESGAPAQRILDAAPLIPRTGALGGWAAAHVLGADWLDGIDGRTGVRLPVMIVLGSTVGRGQNVGVRWVRHRLPIEDTMRRHDLSITTALRTTFDGIRMAPGIGESLVFADAMLHFGLVQLPDLEAYVADHRGWAGVELARRAVGLAEAAVRSPWESRLRAIYVVRAGLPRPVVNPLLIGADGRRLGRPDLFDPEAALAIEFDGADHRERAQHSFDNQREEIFEAYGVTVVRIDSLNITRDLDGTVHRLRDGHRRGLRRPPGSDAWTMVLPPSPAGHLAQEGA